MHRDLKLDNVLLTLPESLATASTATINADITTSTDTDPPTVPLSRLDDQPLDTLMGDPLYLAPATPLSDNLCLNPLPETLDITIQLIDYGAASTFSDTNDGHDAYAYALRPPELVLGQQINSAADIWALGLVIYQLVTLSNLWPSSSYEDTAEEADDELLSRMVSRFGKMPQSLREKWTNSEDFLNEDGEELPELDDDGEPLGEEEENQRKKEAAFEEVLRRGRPVGMGEEEGRAFEKFLRGCLRWEAADRETAEQLLKSEWLVGKWEEVMEENKEE